MGLCVSVVRGLPPDGFAAFIAAMRARGITAPEIEIMTKRNPARLLGLAAS